MGLNYVKEPSNQSGQRPPSLGSVLLGIGSAGDFSCGWAR